MIYLDNTTDTQVIYIPRKAIESSKQTIKPVDININKVTVRDNKLTYKTQIKPEVGTYGYDNVEVNVEVPLGRQRMIDNGTYVLNEPIGTVDVDVKTLNQNKQVVISNNGSYTYTFDKGYDGIGTIEVIVEVVGGIQQLTFRIVPYPSNATVYINGEIRDTYTITAGEIVEYKVVAEGYITEAGKIEVNGDKTLNIDLIQGECSPQKVTYDNAFYPESLAEEVNVNLCNYDFSDMTTMNKKTIPNKTVVETFVADFSNMTDMQRAFSGSTNLKEVVLFNTQNVTNMSRAFSKCSMLAKGPYLDMDSCTNTSYMFQDCQFMESIPYYDTSKCTTITYMFQDCYSLKGEIELDLGSAKSALSMFQGCNLINSIKLNNTQYITNWKQTFRSCGIQYIELDMTAATSAESMLYDCWNLKQAHLMNTGNLTNANYMFSGCAGLRRIDTMDFSNVGDTWLTFSECSNLTYMGALENVKCGVDLSWSPLLTDESLNNIINGLYDFNGEGSNTLHLHPISIAKLTEDMLMQATGKGWNVTEKIN